MDIQNKVLSTYKKSINHYTSDLILQDIFSHQFTEKGLSFMKLKYEKLGKESSGILDSLSLKADKNPPILHLRDYYGEKVDEIEFHPAYPEMTSIALNSFMLKIKWDEGLRE